MFRSVISGREYFFVHAPPITAYDSPITDAARRPKLPTGVSPAHWSVYYFWWEFLRLNKDYRDCCVRLGEGPMKNLYKSFGDIHDLQPMPHHLLPLDEDKFSRWWRTTGASLFSELSPRSPPKIASEIAELTYCFPELLEKIPELKEDYPELRGLDPEFYDDLKELADQSRQRQKLHPGRVLLQISLINDVDLMMKQIRAVLAPHNQKFWKSRKLMFPLYKVHGNYSLEALRRTLAVKRASLEPDGYTKLSDLFEKSGLKAFDRVTHDGADAEAHMRKAASEYLKKADNLIYNVGQGRFPDFTAPPARRDSRAKSRRNGSKA